MIRKMLAPLTRKVKAKVIEWVRQSEEYEKLRNETSSNGVSIAQLADYVKYFKSGVHLPSEKLQRRVVGGYFHDYVASGFRAFNDIKRELTQHAPSFLDKNNECAFLDFGSGPGRVTMAVGQIMPHWKIWGCDIDNEAIEFAKNEYAPLGLNFETVQANGENSFLDNQFNVVLASSVFTHLSEEMQFIWLKELHRITAPGAILLLSVENRKALSVLKEDQLNIVKEKGFYFLEGWLTEGLPDWYRTTIHTHDYIKREWSKYFEILAITELGIMSHQDCIVCRKRESL